MASDEQPWPAQRHTPSMPIGGGESNGKMPRLSQPGSVPGEDSGRGTKMNTSRFLKGTNIVYPRDMSVDPSGIVHILWHPMNLLLLFLPVGIAAAQLEWGDMWVFWLNFMAMVPLAKILGDFTEELAASLKNDMVAGLINATLGNTVELVITIQSLRAGLLNIVKTSLLGSVLSNTLLVLGMSFFCGGLFTMKKGKDQDKLSYDAMSPPDQQGSEVQRGKIQSFSMLGALVNTSMLLVSCLCFNLVTLFRMVLLSPDDEDLSIILPVSRLSSVIIMMAYVAYIIFQLVTHRDAMAEEGGDDDDEEEGSIGTLTAVALLIGTTAVIAYCSELLLGAVSGIVKEEGSFLSEHFIGIILLPIVGNACEHASAVRFAVEDKLGLSVSIAVGSSTQIALFVVPLSVVMGWCMDIPMDLNFGVLNSTLITLSVVVVLSMVVDGQSNWLQGYLLCSVYAIIAIMYYELPNDLDIGLGKA